jgi:hypothetical protein
MSILRVANVHFESTGASRIDLVGDTVNIVAGGSVVLSANQSQGLIIGSPKAAFDKANSALANTGGTISGDLRILGMTDFQDRYSIVANATTNVINCIVSNYFTRTITANDTITFINPPASGNVYAMTLRLSNAGSFVITWANSPRWPSATAPTLTGGFGNTDILVFFTDDGGTTWRGNLVQKDSR